MGKFIPALYAVAGTFRCLLPGQESGEQVACVFGGFIVVSEGMELQGLFADPFGLSEVKGEVTDQCIVFTKQYKQGEINTGEKVFTCSLAAVERSSGSYVGPWSEVSDPTNTGDVCCTINRVPNPTKDERMLTSIG